METLRKLQLKAQIPDVPRAAGVFGSKVTAQTSLHHHEVITGFDFPTGK